MDCMEEPIHLESKQLVVRYNDASTINKFSRLQLNENSQMNIFNNYAKLHGGGIFTDETCEYRNTDQLCFFQFNDIPTTVALNFFSNSAQLGGDAIFGGCLSNCTLHIAENILLINSSIPNSRFWNFTALDLTSQSAIAGSPRKVAFCAKSKDSSDCGSALTVTVYRGQRFNISMMVVDTVCVPSIDGIHASIRNESGSVQFNDVIYQSKKICHDYPYSITGDPTSTSAVLEFIPQSREFHPNLIPAHLTIIITECPLGFKGSDSECTCYEMLQDFKIECISSRVS